MWYYKGKEFTSEDIGDYVGFVYVLTNLSTNKKYIGKKTLISKRRLPPLKGQKRRRTKIVESDWKTYYGSNDEIKTLVENSGGDLFHREILHLCKGKGEMSYLEMKEQVEREVLLKPDEYYNGIIQVKIHRNHVKGLMDGQDNTIQEG
jgi:hypothetical protein